MSGGRILVDVAVVLVAARIGALVLERLGQPGVMGEILAGVALGPSLLGALPGDPSAGLFHPRELATLDAIAQIGLVLFMFRVGWDLDLRLVRRGERAAAVIAAGSVLVPFATGLALAVPLYDDTAIDAGFWPFALFTAAALSLTAFPVLARILDETGLAGQATATLALTAAAIVDLVGWLILAIALTVLDAGSPWQFLRIVAETALFVAGVVFLARPLLARLVPAAGALVVPCALLGAYATSEIGIHAVFGAFLVGAAMPRAPEAAGTRLHRDVGAAVALLAPLYFVRSGMGVDLPGLEAGDLGLLALVFGAACVSKLAGTFGAARLAGVRRDEARVVGVLMNTRGLVEIVLLTVGREAGLIDDRLFTLFVLMAIGTTLLTTPLLGRLMPRRRRSRARTHQGVP